MTEDMKSSSVGARNGDELARRVAALAEREVASALGMLESPDVRAYFSRQIGPLEQVLADLKEIAEP